MTAAPQALTAHDDGYIRDVEYTGEFYPHLAPARLAYVAAINGYRSPDIGGRFTWCELGCGQGITSLILAATHPAGEFHACDFNAAHIDRAESLRRAGRVENLRLHRCGFRELIERDLPTFDFIVLHGVYSWVSEDTRTEIREFIARKLRPGGLAMLSYNAMPGWAHISPIRRIMRAHAASQSGSSLDKARSAYAFVERLARQGAGYFATLPAAAEHIGKLATHDIRYVAHEYLTPHNEPFWFDEVAGAMGEAGLAYAGNMTIADNYRELMVPDAFRDLIAAQPTRAAVEAQRDIIVNAAFHQDLYAAQSAVEPDRDVGLAELAATEYSLLDLPERLPLTRSAGWLQFDLSDRSAPVRSTHARLAHGPASADDIHAAAGLRTRDDTAFLIQQLVVSGHLAPCCPNRRPAGWSELDSALIEAAIREHWQRVPLACPHTGAASDTEVVSAVAIEAAVRIDDAIEAGRHVVGRLRAHGYPVNRWSPSGERTAASEQDIVDHIAAVWAGLRDPAHPQARRLKQFGILF